ncbi:MAG TPA: hypothetical protein VHU87_01090 [Rhizomicrobium sp.]|jgi:hypothetical protein|nr:hypothetical protein [Rhizomicrobium sp.]
MAKKKKTKAKPAKKRAAKAVKTRNAVKAKKIVKAKKTRKPARKAIAKKTVKKTAAKKTPVKKAPTAKKSREVLGEGNYTASRRFRTEETAFVKRNKARIPAMGKAAGAALEGPEGKDLMAAEAEASAHAHMPQGE